MTAEQVCASKKRFDTKVQAQKFAARCRGLGLAPAKVYHCPVCAYFHLTTKHPVEPPNPAPQQTPKREAPPVKRTPSLAERMLAGANQRMRYDDRVVLDVSADLWDRWVEMAETWQEPQDVGR
jgi:hypothetical protein